MVKLGFFFTGYLFVSLAIFLLLSFTINGWIVYGLFLLPCYGLALIVGWLRLLKHRHQTARFKHGVWLTIMALQMGVVLTSPGNCYMAKQGASCYSNLQIFFGNVPRLGATTVPHWTIAEHAFYGLLVAYAIALALGLWTTSFHAERDGEES